jgi:O-antigen/teichoic acid export membrane protein
VRSLLLRFLKPLQVALVRVIGSVLQLGLSLVLAHLSGLALLGHFLFFVAIVNLCIGSVALPNLLLRYASRSSVERVPQVGWLWRQGLELALLCGLGVAFVGDPWLRDVGLAVGGLLIQRMSSAALKGGGHPNLGVLLDTACYPLVVLLCVVFIHRGRTHLTMEPLRLSYLAAIWGAAFVAVVLTWRQWSSIRSAWSAPRRTPRAMYSEVLTLSLGLVAYAVTSNAPLVLAPLFLNAAETGRLGLALRAAGFATTILAALSAYFGPAFARAINRKELLELRRRSQSACLMLYVPVPIAVLLLPTEWLKSISPGLGSVKVLVVLLSLGFFVNAATGLAPNLLVMRGWSSVFLITNVTSAVLTVGALVVGGVLAGSKGMAVGLSGAMALTNIWIFIVSTRQVSTMEEALPFQPPVGSTGGHPATGAT